MSVSFARSGKEIERGWESAIGPIPVVLVSLPPGPSQIEMPGPAGHGARCGAYLLTRTKPRTIRDSLIIIRFSGANPLGFGRPILRVDAVLVTVRRWEPGS